MKLGNGIDTLGTNGFTVLTDVHQGIPAEIGEGGSGLAVGKSAEHVGVNHFILLVGECGGSGPIEPDPPFPYTRQLRWNPVWKMVIFVDILHKPMSHIDTLGQRGGESFCGVEPVDSDVHVVDLKPERNYALIPYVGVDAANRATEDVKAAENCVVTVVQVIAGHDTAPVWRGVDRCLLSTTTF